MFTQIVALSLAAVSMAADPSVNILGWSTGQCNGVVTASYQITDIDRCHTLDRTFSGANVTTSDSDIAGCSYSFFTGDDCFRTSFIAEYDYGTKSSDQCIDFFGKQAKSAVLNCPSQ